MSIDFVVLARFYLDSGPEALSDTPVTHPSWDYEGRVLQWGFIERSIPSPIGLPRIGDAKIRIADTDRKFRDLLAVQTPRRRFVELKILEVGTSEAATDPIYRGECVNMSFGPGYCEATLRDRTYAWIDELIPNLINRVNFPNLAQGTDEAFFPIVNGECLSPADNPQGVISLPHIGLEVASPPSGDRYAASLTPIDDIVVYRKLPELGTFSLVTPDEYAVTTESMSFAELPGIDINPTFIDFIVEQPEGTQIRADIWGINFRGEWNGIPAAEGLQPNRNPINFFINMIFFIMAKAGQTDRVWDIQSIEDTLDAFEVMLDTPSGPDRLKCDGAITKAQTAREWLGNFLPNFQIDMYQKKNGKLAIAYVEDTNPDRFLFTAGRDVEINSFFEDIASPTVNQCRYHFAKNFASGDFAENQIFDNTDDQHLLGPLYNDFGSPIMRVDKLEVDDFNFDFVRDSETALFAITRHMSFLALGSYRQTWSMDLFESIDNLELASLIGITHFDGLSVGGYVNKEAKVLGLNIDLDKMKVTVRSILRVPEPIAPFTGIPTSVEEYEDLSDVNPVRSFIDDGALAIDNDEDTCAVLSFHSSSSVTPNYANLLISGFPANPLGPFTTATIHIITQRLTGGSSFAPSFTADVFNQRNKQLIPSGNTVGSVANLQNGLGVDVAKTEFTVSFSAIDFATNFPGGASDIWVRCGQYDSLNLTCSPDVLYKIFKVWISYV